MMVLDLVPQGKAVIRPIAFRPLQGAGGGKSHSGHAGHGQAPAAARLSNAGERYGSTPVLARPGTRLALHGSKYPAEACKKFTYSHFHFALDLKAPKISF